jgi:hypothetical protein
MIITDATILLTALRHIYNYTYGYDDLVMFQIYYLIDKNVAESLKDAGYVTIPEGELDPIYFNYLHVTLTWKGLYYVFRNTRG